MRFFAVEQYFKKQNDRINAESSKEAPQFNKVQRGQYSTSVLVWLGAIYDIYDDTERHFLKKV